MEPDSEEVLRDLIRDTCKGRFYDYVRLAHNELFPEEFIDGPHIEVLCDLAQTVITGDNSHCGLVKFPTGYDIAVVNIPPGHMKSRLFSVLLQSWTMGPLESPAHWLSATLVKTLSIRDSDACREVIKRPWFQEHWPLEFKKSQDAKSNWSVTTGASRLTTSTEAKTTGMRGHIQNLDDPQDLNASAYEIEEANKWIRGNWCSRDNFGESRPKNFLIQQRVGDNDATRLYLDLFPQEVLHIWLPAEFEPDNACPYDWRTEEGELLWPEAYAKAVPSGDPQDWLAKKKRSTGPINWATQYQQRPFVTGGQEFKAEWLNNPFTRLAVQDVDRFLISVDSSFKGGETSDWCVLGLVAKIGAHYYLCDVLRRKMDYPTLKQSLVDYAQGWRAKGVPVDTVIVEDKANGSALLSDLQKHVSGLVPYSPKDSKIVRYRSISGILAAQQFFLPGDGACIVTKNSEVPLRGYVWIDDLKFELLAIPNGKHDDQADMIAQAILYAEQQELQPDPIGEIAIPEVDVYTVQRSRRWG